MSEELNVVSKKTNETSVSCWKKLLTFCVCCARLTVERNVLMGFTPDLLLTRASCGFRQCGQMQRLLLLSRSNPVSATLILDC